MKLPSFLRARPAQSITPGAALDAKTRVATVEQCREEFAIGQQQRANARARATKRSGR